MQRLILTVLVAFVAAIVAGPFIIPWLKKMKVSQTINAYGPKSHAEKQGMTTMGGFIFIAASLLATLIFALGKDYRKHFPLFCVVVTLLFAGIGFLDDFIKARKARSEGLTPRQKLIPQIVFGIAISIFAYLNPYIGSKLRVPFTDAEWNLGIFYIPVMTFIIVGVVNSSNLLDGLDGLCAGSGFSIFAAFALIALSLSLAGGETDADLYGTSLFCGAFCGALLGFLRFNTYPATVFMGDIGSFAIGGALVSVAIVTRLALLLPIVAFTMMISSVSDLIQITYMRRHGGKRILRMAPLHHHFELSGIPETRIVTMYDIVTALFCLIALCGYVA